MIGIIVNDLSVGQLSYCLTMQAKTRNDLYFYTREMAPLIQRVNCPILPMREAVYQNDVLIATDLDSANFLRKLPTPARKIYYVWSIEWLNHGNDFVYSSSILNSPLEIIARSKDHARQLQISGHCDAIIEEANLEAFERYMKDHDRKAFYINTGQPIQRVCDQ